MLLIDVQILDLMQYEAKTQANEIGSNQEEAEKEQEEEQEEEED